MFVPAVPILRKVPMPGGYNVAGGNVVVGWTASVRAGVWTIVLYCVSGPRGCRGGDEDVALVPSRVPIFSATADDS